MLTIYKKISLLPNEIVDIGRYFFIHLFSNVNNKELDVIIRRMTIMNRKGVFKIYTECVSINTHTFVLRFVKFMSKKYLNKM